MDNSDNLTVINCKEVVASHGGYRSAGQVWSFMQRELEAAGTQQFVTLEKNRASGGTLAPRAIGRRAARKGGTSRKRR